MIENPDPTSTNESELNVKVTNLDPMIIIESQTEGIKFECHNEESLINSQVLWRTNRRSKPHVCLDFHSKINSLITMSACYL